LEQAKFVDDVVPSVKLGIKTLLFSSHYEKCKACLRQHGVQSLGLTKETENLIDADALGRMKKSAFLINTARGKIVNEAALIAAMRASGIACAAIDVTAEEPLPAESPLWDLPNVFITPHSAGETRRYEDNVLDILEENLQRLWRGEAKLRNQIV